MTNSNSLEFIPADDRMTLVENIIAGQTTIPFNNVSIGDRLSDELTVLDIFALYSPGNDIGYELISTRDDLSYVGPTRARILSAEINPDSLVEIEDELAKQETFSKKSGQNDDLQKIELGGLVSLRMSEYPHAVIGFGRRLRDDEEVTIMFYPSHLHPQPLLEGFKSIVQSVIEEEKF